jgi:hypothetical protein
MLRTRMRYSKVGSKYEVVLRANLPEGCLEMVFVADICQEVWDSFTVSKWVRDGGRISSQFCSEEASRTFAVGAGQQVVVGRLTDVVFAARTLVGVGSFDSVEYDLEWNVARSELDEDARLISAELANDVQVVTGGERGVNIFGTFYTSERWIVLCVMCFSSFSLGIGVWPKRSPGGVSFEGPPQSVDGFTCRGG